MDGRGFDELARAVAGVGRSASRRGLVRRLAAGAGGVLAVRGVVAEAGAACKARGKACERNGDCCSKRCKGNECKCSKLGVACKSEADCCLGLGTAVDCCGGVCVDTSADRDHCGGCGLFCRSPEVCGPPCCLPAGETCSLFDPCCGGLDCTATIENPIGECIVSV